MELKGDFDIKRIAGRFDIFGEFQGAEPYGSGHINDTFRATYYQGGATIHYLHQRLNDAIFRNPEAVMENILRVTRHIRGKLDGEVGASRRVLTAVPTLEGGFLHFDDEGHPWRTYVFIEDARTFDSVESPEQAYQAAKAFGLFQRQLADLGGPRLHETIPDFHHTPKRLTALERAIEIDPVNRAALARPEITFAVRRKDWAGTLVDLFEKGEIPERVTHNDTKFNNVMLDDSTGEAICVVDLDTVMPGLALYDFGDMVRTTTCAAPEDETDLSRVEMSLPMYEALLRGYLETAGPFLNETERELLAFSGRLITFETGVRFLTDYLLGDAYFKVHRPAQNLDRARAQFKLVESIERQEAAMQALLTQIAPCD